ncbi:MAG: glycosyltransferase family 39 protein [Streptosporangiaceae bacterium]
MDSSRPRREESGPARARAGTAVAEPAAGPAAGPAAPRAGPRPPVTRPRPRAPGWLLDWTALAGPAVTLALMLWGLTAHPFWGDEADTISAASRSLPQLLRLLGHVDAVHGLYYLLLWPVVRLAGPSEFAVRLPSALAMAAAAAGVTAIGRRLVSRQAGLYAGLVFALLPTVTRQAHDARPYALLTAAAALASYLLIRLAERPTLRLLAGYAGCLVAVGHLQLCGMLLLPAHAIALAALAPAGRARTMRRWLASLAVAPVAIIGWQQRAQIAWIPRPGWHDGTDLVTTLLAGPAAAAAAIGLLGLAGLARGGRLSWLAAPWLLLPPVLLLALSELKPVYNGRYLTFCLPAVALLAGAGLAALNRPGRVIALAAVLSLAAPAVWALRVPTGGMRAVAEFLRAAERPGDAIAYPGHAIPPWYLAYPEGFARLRDVSLARTGATLGHLYASTVPRAVLDRRERRVRRIWVVQTVPSQRAAGYLAPGFRLAREWHLAGGATTVWLYEKPGRGITPGRAGKTLPAGQSAGVIEQRLGAARVAQLGQRLLL